jgi:hypothetical protein
MAKRRWSGLVAVGVAAIVVLGTVLLIALVVIPRGSKSTTPSAEIRAAVKDFEGAAVRHLRLMDPWPGLDLTRVGNGEAEYGFNPERKSIELALYSDSSVGGDNASITREEAEATATEFARKHCSDLSVFTLQTGSEGPATVMPSYGFEWVQLIDGVPTPNSVLVQVNAGTGKVTAYVYRYQLLHSPGTPTLSQEEARAVVADRVMENARAAASEAGMAASGPFSVSFLQDPELRIVVKDSEQLLVWRITAEAQGDLPWVVGGQYDIDAQDGTIVEDNPFA